MCGHGTIGVAVDAGPPGPDRPGRAPARDPGRRGDGHARRTPTTSPIDNVPSYRTAKGVAVDVPGLRPIRRRRRLGRQLVLPGAGPRRDARRWPTSNGSPTSPGGSARPCVARASPATDGAEIDHIELFGPPTRAGRRQQELRALPRQGLRPLALRHRHQRQARLPGRRRQARRGPGLAAGEHHRQRLRGLGPDRRTAGSGRGSAARRTSTPRPP